jgi:excisionase family DNA binding protein
MTPELVTLAEASKRYSVSERVLRALITAGKLPASKPGKSYLVAPADLARLFAPVVRVALARVAETPTRREDRQLQQAGFAPRH